MLLNKKVVFRLNYYNVHGGKLLESDHLRQSFVIVNLCSDIRCVWWFVYRDWANLDHVYTVLLICIFIVQ